MHFLGQGPSHLNLPLGNFQEKVDPPVEQLKFALRQRDALMIARKFICPSSWGFFLGSSFPCSLPIRVGRECGRDRVPAGCQPQHRCGQFLKSESLQLNFGNQVSSLVLGSLQVSFKSCR